MTIFRLAVIVASGWALVAAGPYLLALFNATQGAF